MIIVLSIFFLGNPLTSEHVRWERNGVNITETVTFETRNMTSFLVISHPKRADVGNFQCVVNNGIGGETRQDVMLIVKFKPEMDTGPSLIKSASNVGEVGRLLCR